MMPRTIPTGPSGMGTSALRLGPARPAGDPPVPELYCPPAVRDDPALGEVVNDALVEWAGRVGIYPGQLDRVRAANFGRLMMLAHPDADEPDRLLAAARCALTEWATDDHYVDDPSLGADPELLPGRLALAGAVVDPAHLPVRYAPELERAVRADPVLVAYREAFAGLASYASASQVARLRDQLITMFMAYSHEASWRFEGRLPAVYEYLVHRHENSFLPCMVLIDAMGGYEVPAGEYEDARVRRAFTRAGVATVIMNDLYSMSKEDPADASLPRVIATEDGCSLPEAMRRSAALHDELMHSYEAESAALSRTGSPALQRFLAGVWVWLGGNHEWHRTSVRYRGEGGAQ